jgi:hypothetical protein
MSAKNPFVEAIEAQLDAFARLLTSIEGALDAVCAVIQRGAATHPGDDWRKHQSAEHVEHAIEHLRRLKDGDQSEDHLARATTRLVMALQITCSRETTHNV